MLLRLWGLVLFGILIVLSACDRQPPHSVETFSGSTMGTSYTVKLTDFSRSSDRTRVETAIESALNAVDQRMSTYRENSEVSIINRTRDVAEPITVSPALADVLAEALRIGNLSGGAYDITIGPLVNVWGFGPEKRKNLPTEAEIQAAREKVGLDKIELDTEKSRLLKRHPEVYIDLSSIAKGYAVDQVALQLESLGIENYMIEVGGELRLKGMNPHGGPWRIAIEKPVSNPIPEVHQVLQLSDVGMATSGDYRNFIENNGRHYSHTIDPTTGQTIQHNLASVTVIAPQCMTADAWATALMALGPEKGRALALQEGLAAFFILNTDDGFEEYMTPAFEQYMVEIRPQNPAVQ